MSVLLLIVAFSGLFAYGMAKAGLYAALRKASSKHRVGCGQSGSDTVCLRCLRRELESKR